MGGTKTAYGVFDQDKKLVKRHQHVSDGSLTPERFFDRIVGNIHELMRACGIDGERLRGVGIGMPSYVHYEEGHIVKTVNLPKIQNFPARSYLMKELGGTRVILDNDSHTGALAEFRNGAGRGFENMLYCPVSTGISSGIIIGGKLFRGRYGWAGESGHMIVTPGQGLACGCGNRGCLMSWCSGAMIVKHIRQWIEAGDWTQLLSMVDSPEDITCEMIDRAYDLGDAMAVKAVNQMAEYLAVWIYNLYVTLNINCYIFGGGLLNMGDKLFGRMKENFHAYNQDDMPVYFKTAELGNDFGIIGAAELLF